MRHSTHYLLGSRILFMMRKILMGALAVAFIATPLFASADTLSDLQAQVQQLLAQIASIQSQLNTSTAGAAATDTTNSPAAGPALSGNLYAGEGDATTNGGVTLLQQFLGISPTTGYFGSATLQAVENWQSSHSIVSSGTASTTGFGFVGPRTRAAMGFGVSTSGNTGSGTAGGSAQNVTFFATPKSGAAPLSVYFRYNNSTSGGSYSVSFGDGTSGTLTYEVPPCASSAAVNCPSYYVTSHTYASIGTYTATLSPQYACPMNTDGTVGICNTPNEAILGTVTITVTSTDTGVSCPGGAAFISGGCPPLPTPAPTPVTFTATPTSGAVPLTVTFTSNTFGTVSFGDGTSGMLNQNAIPMYMCALGANSNCVNPTPSYSTSHTYTSANTYTAVLTKGNCACPLNGECNCPNQAVLGTVVITVTGNTVTNPYPTTPSVTLTASPTSITSGSGATLTWSSANATACTGNGFSTGGTNTMGAGVISVGATNGSVTVYPTQTTPYSVSCTNGLVSAVGSATVTVITAGGTACPAIARVCPTGQVDQVSANCMHTCVASTPTPSPICNCPNASGAFSCSCGAAGGTSGLCTFNSKTYASGSTASCTVNPSNGSCPLGLPMSSWSCNSGQWVQTTNSGSGAGASAPAGASGNGADANILSQMASAVTAIEAILKALGAN